MMKLHPSIQSLLAEIETFRGANDISPTNFGLMSVNDGKFLTQLRSGRVPSLTTIDKVRAFMLRRERSAA